MTPHYPIYIISKGRWERRWTARALDEMSVPYKIVVEPQEYDSYAAVIDPAKILTLPFSNLGQGSIPARNWCWEHSIAAGAERHWILDDNIDGFYRMNRNQKIRVISPAIFRASEDFVERYTNIAMAGFQYEFFAWRRAAYPVFLLNTRVYSCILLKNDIVHRWRGRYNEDTDLSLRIMKDGMCTVLFYAFLCKKLSTMTCAGGNTEELYSGDGRLKMAESLQAQHPDVCRIIHKYGGRWQHEVDYSRFAKNFPIEKRGAIIPQGINEYGMEISQSPEYRR